MCRLVYYWVMIRFVLRKIVSVFVICTTKTLDLILSYSPISWSSFLCNFIFLILPFCIKKVGVYNKKLYLLSFIDLFYEFITVSTLEIFLYLFGYVYVPSFCSITRTIFNASWLLQDYEMCTQFSSSVAGENEGSNRLSSKTDEFVVGIFSNRERITSSYCIVCVLHISRLILLY